MKILVFNINQTTVMRGAEVFWQNLQGELERYGVQVEIISSDKKAIQNKSVSIFSKILRRLYLDAYSLRVLFFTLQNVVRLINGKFDVVIPTNGGWQTLLIRVMRQTGLIGKAKIVLIGHAGIGHDDEFNVRHGKTDIFIAITQEQEIWAKKLNPKLNVVYIPNGIDTREFSPEGEKFNYELPRPVFLAVASLEKYKNLDKTIKAIGELEKGSLVIIGTGREKENLEKLAREKLAGRFLTMSVLHEEMPKYYRGADAFTLISGHQEAFGLVYLEAMACGLPVVATDDDKRREIINAAGILVDPNNSEEYKTALMKAVILDWDGKPHLQAAKFSWEKIGEKYFAVLQKLI